ncbi:MAG: biotin--[acetyl-CoA-carboxylase] ligase [Gammaproteobacteria bacterium RIFCSPHIGHO2_12_FULL_45_9]|nr:MAG: biotin--[acetyl-CoA-carboxylase] ligase [Gammaproteobacteria bacterium RIFCSPHIGHO2_12_FULL_45_9]
MEQLDAIKVIAAIRPESRRQLSRLEILPVVDSTNTYLLQKMRTNMTSGWVCLAEQQTQGRGRQGKTWYSPVGSNIYSSLLWRFQSIQNLPGLSLAVAVMVVDALQAYGISEGIQLKWPNDIWFAGRKLGGVLIENVNAATVIGIGMNLQLPRDVLFSPSWIDIEEMTAATPRRNYLIGLLLDSLLMQLPVFAVKGLAAFLPRWRRFDVLYKQRITVRSTQQEMHGVAQGVNDMGELLLSDSSEVIRAFGVGEVSIGMGIEGS